ncbi:MAG: MBL fold metallo-hydrolase, partial [Sulfitobacter sp.]|nr:MBL fold metallo-hydrolase [Sulfitobacter sp.]
AFEHDGHQSLRSAIAVTKERAEKTVLTPPTITFEDEYIVEMGDMKIEARYLGPAHSPGDIVLWMPDLGMIISGDMAFHERMLPIFPDTITADWIETWETAFEPLGATYVIPGHGHPTNMAQVRRYTHDYLVYLREKIGAHIDAGGDLAKAYYVDQSPYTNLDTFEELATKNAGRVYEQMEFE